MHKRKVYRQSKAKFTFFKDVNIFKVLSILLIVIFTFFIPSAIKKLVRINKIECVSQFGSCSYNFLTGDYGFVKRQIEDTLRNNIEVNSYLIQYKIPSTVRVDLVLKRPKYSVKNSSGVYYILDKDGVVIKVSNQSDLLNIDHDVDHEIGDKVSNEVLFALKLISKVQVINGILVSKIENNILIIELNNGIKIMLPLEGDIDVLAGSLRLIFSRLNEGSQGIRIEDVSEIDLRFKNVILR